MRTREPVKRRRGPPKAYISAIQMLEAFRRDITMEDFKWAMLEKEAFSLSEVQKHKSVRFERMPKDRWDLVTEEHWIDELTHWPGLGYLNYPSRFTKKLARLAALRAQMGNPSLLLASAGVGDGWFDQFVWGRADIFFLRPRARFEGYKAGHFLDYFLALYPFQGKRAEGYLYDWRTGEKRLMVPATPKVK